MCSSQSDERDQPAAAYEIAPDERQGKNHRSFGPAGQERDSIVHASFPGELDFALKF